MTSSPTAEETRRDTLSRRGGVRPHPDTSSPGERIGACWPTNEQVLLLRASLLSREAALDAWREWRSRVDFEGLDSGSYRVLPLLYHNLRSHGICDPNMNKLKGIYRLTWYKNSTLFDEGALLLRHLHEHGLQTMILDGAQVILHYRDFGLRPTDDFGLLVRQGDALASIGILRELGWEPSCRAPEILVPVAQHVAFRNVAGRAVYLHWHILNQSYETNGDEDFWSAAVSTEIAGTPVRAPSPTHQLLRVCVDGAEWNAVPPLRWAADAMMILRTSSSEIEWDLLVAQAQKHRVTRPALDALGFLTDALDAPVPAVALECLRNTAVSVVEMDEYRARTSRPTVLSAARVLWFRYLRFCAAAGLHAGPLGFASFVRQAWALEHLREMPIQALGRVALTLTLSQGERGLSNVVRSDVSDRAGRGSVRQP